MHTWVASPYEEIGHELETIIDLDCHLHHDLLNELLKLLKSDEAPR